MTSRPLIADVEGGSLATFRAKRIALIRPWRRLPRLVKIFVALLLVSLLMSSIVTIRGWPELPRNPTSAAKNDQKSYLPTEKHDNQDLIKSVISLKPFAKPRQSPDHEDDSNRMENSLAYTSFVKMEGDFEEDEISWQKDILKSRVPLNQRQKAVVQAMLHSWKGYRNYAWGMDTLKPISRTGSTWFGVGLTILDSLDTLLIMGLGKEFKEALDWVEKDLNFHTSTEVNCFEMTIRVLGGLLSAYHLTRSYVVLEKAVDVGDRLIHCFDSPSKVVPYSDLNLYTKNAKAPLWLPGSSTSEVSTMQLEFRDLSRITKQSIYETISFRTSQHLHNLTADDPLVSMFINPVTGHFAPSTITLGARSDSYYEYLFKQYLQTSNDWLKEDFLKAMDAIRNRLTRVTQGEKKLTFVGELLVSNPSVHPKMDHLVCFLPGLLALASYHLTREDVYTDDYSVKSRIDQLLPMGQALARTCYLMYNLTATGLSPEIAYFNEYPEKGGDELQIRPADTHNLLRPEYAESLFYLYHITKNEKYKEEGWEILQAFNRYCKVPSGGYTSIGNVKDPKRLNPRDEQESFWTAETLKYLFLLFSDDQQLINKVLNNYIINTEGHFIRKHYKNQNSSQ